MRKKTLISVICIVFLFFFSFAGKRYGSRMQAAIDTAGRLGKIQPAPVRDIPVAYHGADLLRFIDSEHLLVGALTFDDAGTPVYGPVILYDLERGKEQWHISRAGDPAARHRFVALSPDLILRTEANGHITHRAYNPASGKKLWSHRADEKSLQAYGFSPSLHLADLFVLSGGQLTGIDARSGTVRWKTTAPTDGSTPGAQLVALQDLLVLVGDREISACDPKDGRLLWRLPNTLGADVHLLPGPPGFYLYQGRTALHVNPAGKIDWQWQSRDGGVKLIASFTGGRLVVTHDRKSGRDRLQAMAGSGRRWAAGLPGLIMSPLLQEDKMVLLTTAPQQTERGERTLVGLSPRNGKVLVRIDLDPAFTRAEIDFAPLPDRLIQRKKDLLVLRENYGITAIDLQGKRIAWSQPMAGAPKAENMSLMSRVEPGFNLTLKDRYKPAYISSSLKSDQNTLNLQMKYQHLQQATGSLTSRRPDLGDSAGATAASMKLQRDFTTAASALVAMNAIADAGNAFWKAYGESLIRKTNIAAKTLAITGIRIAEAQYHAALSPNYFLPAPTETLTLVDLDSGRRTDLTATLALPNLPGRAWTVALSPDETRLVAVGIGLNHRRYKSITRGMLAVPASSLVVYDPATLAFKKQRTAAQKAVPHVSKTAAAAPPPPAAATPDAAYMIKAGYPPLVAYALKGTLAEVKKALAAGENVNTPYAAFGLTPLMAATSRGDVAMVKLLLGAGADVHAKSVFGKTAFEVADRVKDMKARGELKKLLAQ